MSPISAGTAYVDVLPNMGKFAPAVAGQTSAASGALAKFGKVGALAVAAVGAGSVVMAADFEKSMRNVNSIAQLPERAFDRLNERVLDLAGPTAQAPKTLAEGLYDLVSSGFDANESLKVLRASALAATAGLTTTDVSTKAVAAVLNAYRLPAERAAQVSDQLFKTVDRGVITFEELATNIGDTLPFAASLGVGLDEVGAATATMTKQGLGASETFTRIRNLLQTMIKPGEGLTKAIDELGYESGEALVAEKGLQGALEAVIGTTKGTKDEVAELFPNIRALGGALALTGDNADAARKDLDGMKDSAGATKRAFEEQSKSLAVQWDKLKANLSVLAIRIGNVLVPAITDAVKWLNEDLGPAFQRVGEIARDVGSRAAAIWRGIVGVFRAVVNWIDTAATNIANFVRDFIPLKVAIAAVKIAIRLLAPVFNTIRSVGRVALAVLAGAWRVVAAAVRGVWGVVRAFGSVAGNVIGVVSNLLRGDLGDAWRNVRELIGSVAGFMKEAISGAVGVVKAAFQGLRGVASAVFDAIETAVGAVKSVIDGLIAAVEALIGKLGSAVSAAGDVKNAVDDVTGFLNPVGGGGPNIQDLFKAGGGAVRRGGSYIVGEQGPELFTPRTSGRIVPNHRLQPALAGAAISRADLTITNWREGTGYMRLVAGDEVDSARRFDTQRARMRPRRGR